VKFAVKLDALPSPVVGFQLSVTSEPIVPAWAR